MQYNMIRKDFIEIIEDVFNSDDHINKKLDIEEFKNIYFNKVIKRLKQPNGKYRFTREEYQTSIRLYLYYSDEKNIYNLLVLAMIEKRLFDERNDK